MDYFVKREMQHIEKMKRADKQQAREIADIIKKAQLEIEKEISNLQQTVASSQRMTVAELLRESDRMDVARFNEKAKIYVRTKDFSATANRELKLYNYKMQANRLELIKAQLNLELTAMTEEINGNIDKRLWDDARKEFSRQAGILSETVPKRLDARIKGIINGSYLVDSTEDFVVFSTSVWGYKKILQAELEKVMLKAVLMGQNPKKTAKDIMTAFDVTRAQAVRLARTESARIQTEIQHEMYQKADVQWYQVIGESDACDKCKAYLDKTFRVDEWIYTPPYHPHCRCSVVPLSERY